MSTNPTITNSTLDKANIHPETSHRTPANSPIAGSTPGSAVHTQVNTAHAVASATTPIIVSIDTPLINKVSGGITPDNIGPHYYGIYVRRIFFGIGLLMLLALPFYAKEITVGTFASMFGILVINLFAGMTNPRQKTLIFFDVIISLIGTLFFELFAYFRYDTYGTALDSYFWFNEVIAIAFFIALYLSIKTFRGMVVKA